MGFIPIKKGGILHTDPPVKAELLNNQFQSVFVKGDVSSNIPTLDGDPFSSIGNLTITVAGVEKLLSHLAVHKASGPDQIPNCFLKKTATDIARILANIFFRITNDRCFTSWLATCQCKSHY